MTSSLIPARDEAEAAIRQIDGMLKVELAKGHEDHKRLRAKLRAQAKHNADQWRDVIKYYDAAARATEHLAAKDTQEAATDETK